MKMQFMDGESNTSKGSSGSGSGHHHVVHHTSMPTHNHYYHGHGYGYGHGYGAPWFRYPSGNSVYYNLYGNAPIEYMPTGIRTNSTREMEILSRVYLGGVGLVGLLILYNLLDKK